MALDPTDLYWGLQCHRGIMPTPHPPNITKDRQEHRCRKDVAKKPRPKTRQHWPMPASCHKLKALAGNFLQNASETLYRSKWNRKEEQCPLKWQQDFSTTATLSQSMRYATYRISFTKEHCQHRKHIEQLKYSTIIRYRKKISRFKHKLNEILENLSK